MNKKNNREKVILAGYRPRGIAPGEYDDPYIELERLAETSGAQVIALITQAESQPTSKFYLGSGKVREIAEAAEELEARAVIFNHDLSPLHFRNLERELNVKVIDRTQLILDIFAMRAQSAEGKIQVELAQLEYLLPRISGIGAELSRLGGGIGTRGPGETKLETDRRRIRTKISVLKQRLKKVESNRLLQKSRREKSGVALIALVGYTNAGKTTLFNKLCAEKAFVEDKLFATLDPLTRKIFIPGSGVALLTDTVGFIQNLPVKLVESFKSTLEGLRDADLLLHVIDISDPQYESQTDEVRRIILELNAGPIPRVHVLNKIDALEAPDRAVNFARAYPDCAQISAKSDIGLAGLKQLIGEKLTAIKEEKANPAAIFDEPEEL